MQQEPQSTRAIGLQHLPEADTALQPQRQREGWRRAVAREELQVDRLERAEHVDRVVVSIRDRRERNREWQRRLPGFRHQAAHGGVDHQREGERSAR